MTTATATVTPSTLPVPAAWQAWRELSDSLTVAMAIDAASRRIAAAYGR